ncbi:hypothetical protein ACLMJK_009252 [Lecanora helva]
MELFLFHFRQTGNTVEQCFIGDIAFDTIDPANLEAILSTRAKDFHFGRRRDITFPLLGDGIFTQEGAAWKRSRELLRAPLQHKHYETLDVFKQSVDDLIEVLSNHTQTGVVDLQPLFFALTLDVSSEFLFGESVKSLKAPETATEQTFHGAFSTAQTFLAKRFRLPDLYWLIGGSKFKKACDDVHQFADQIIDRNLSSSKSENSVFLNSLAECTADRDALRGQIINLLAAGRDTTACLLTWTFFLLVRHPRVLEKLREEIDANHTANLTRTDLRRMGYLQNVLKETLRLYPSVPVNDRKASKTTLLPTGGGPDRTAPVLIPKGATVAWSVYAMHRRPDFYGMDAELFRPERWDEDMPINHDKTTAAWGYLPFNGGPRTCLGMDFAFTEAAYAVFRILHHFPIIRLPAGQNVELIGVEKQTITLVLQSTEGCLVDFGSAKEL